MVSWLVYVEMIDVSGWMKRPLSAEAREMKHISRENNEINDNNSLLEDVTEICA